MNPTVKVTSYFTNPKQPHVSFTMEVDNQSSLETFYNDVKRGIRKMDDEASNLQLNVGIKHNDNLIWNSAKMDQYTLASETPMSTFNMKDGDRIDVIL